MRMTFAALCLLVAWGDGCTQGSSRPSDGGATDSELADSGPPIEDGTVAGVRFNPKDSSWNSQKGSGFGFSGEALFVSVAGYDGDCQVWGSTPAPADGQDLIIGVANIDASGASSPPTLAQEFVVNSDLRGVTNAKAAQIYYQGDCLQKISYQGVSGSVALTLVTAQEVRGTYDLYLSCVGFSGCGSNVESHITGSFDAAQCLVMDVNRSFVCADGGQ